MPTPFTHLEIAQRLLIDGQIPQAIREELDAHRPAYLLGSIAADGRVNTTIGREVTHFYQYDIPIIEHPWIVMLETHPALKIANDAAHRAFIAGYVAHLAADEYWSLHMMRPYFGDDSRWTNVTRQMRFLALHLILIHMDERDCPVLQHWQAAQLAAAHPQKWLPFLGDEILVEWRNFVAEQIVVDGCGSQTLVVFGERLGMTAEELRAYSGDPEMMNQHLWRHVPKQMLADLEPELYAFSRDQLIAYWTRFP